MTIETITASAVETFPAMETASMPMRRRTEMNRATRPGCMMMRRSEVPPHHQQPAHRVARELRQVEVGRDPAAGENITRSAADDDQSALGSLNSQCSSRLSYRAETKPGNAVPIAPRAMSDG